MVGINVDDIPNPTGWPSAAGSAGQCQSNRSSTSSSLRSTSTAAACTTPNPAISRTFGGHIAGQALVSAVRTVDPRYQVHSLHGCFLRPGDATKPAVYLVDRPRDGGSFCTRRVNAVQNGEVIFSMGASFQTPQDGIEHQDVMPAVVPPGIWSIPKRGKPAQERRHRAVRRMGHPPGAAGPGDRLPGRPRSSRCGSGIATPCPTIRCCNICALAYMSDLTLLGSAQVSHPEERPHLMVCVAGSRDVVHAALPRRRVVAL